MRDVEQDPIHALGTYLILWTADSSWTVWRDEKSLVYVARNDAGRTLLGYRTYEETLFDWRDRFIKRKPDDAKK